VAGAAGVAGSIGPTDILTEIGAQIDKMLAKLPTLQKTEEAARRIAATLAD
jgi:hypothetical protein